MKDEDLDGSSTVKKARLFSREERDGSIDDITEKDPNWNDNDILKIEGMNIIFGDFQALKDISFTIQKGCMVGLIGPNGCGKTTMMRCITRVYDATSGSIKIDGYEMTDRKPSEIAKIVANVPAETGQTFGLSVYDLIMQGRYPYVDKVWWEDPEDERMTMEAMEAFGLTHLKRKQVSKMSSGEKQRTLIARAYVQEPKLMLVDEPTSHLDMKYKLEVMEYLRSMAHSDITIMVAEHDISLMARYCDLCIIMKKGQIVTIGKPTEVITEDLIRDVYEVDSRVGLDIDGEIYVLPKRVKSD